MRAGAWVSVAGTTAVRPDDDPVGGDDAAEQTREAVRRIAVALAATGADLTDAVRTRLFVTGISRWEEVGRAHGGFFADVRPASSMVQVAALIDPRLLVEVEADAVLDAERAGGPAERRDAAAQSPVVSSPSVTRAVSSAPSRT